MMTGWLNFFDPVAGVVLNRGGGSASKSKAAPATAPGLTRLSLPTADPDWNAAKAPSIPSPSAHGWSANTLTSYLQAFQRGVPKPGTQVATDQQLFQPADRAALTQHQMYSNPKDLDALLGHLETPGVIPSLVATSTGGELSPGAASLYGRMLGTNPPTAVSSQNVLAPTFKPTDVKNNVGGVGDTNRRLHGPGAAQSAWSPQDSQLYKGMNPLQKTQALDSYNQTMPASARLL